MAICIDSPLNQRLPLVDQRVESFIVPLNQRSTKGSTMKFQKGNKFGKGGKRPGAGGKPKIYHQAKAMADEMVKEMVRAYLAASVKPIMHAHFQLAAGRLVDKWHEGKIVGQEFVIDAPTCRHAVDLLLEKDQDDKGEKRAFALEIVLQTGKDQPAIEVEADPDQIEYKIPK